MGVIVKRILFFPFFFLHLLGVTRLPTRQDVLTIRIAVLAGSAFKMFVLAK
jgi:hypothetical protein